ncbi:rhomboid family intramembrane serine protease [bacterium]|nr:rhomboid family intramembrane serine protease [bacterium]
MVFIRTFLFGWHGNYGPHQFKMKFNVWIVLLGFLAIDYIGSKSQIAGLSSISHLSHLGGALAGFLIWFSDKTSKA